MKKEKYILCVECCESEIIKDIKISKKEYKKQLAFLRNQTEKTKEYESPVIERETKKDCDTYTQQANYFTCACSTTSLFALVCKKGYVFKEDIK